MEVTNILDAREIYYLNRALDGKKIIGINESECLINKLMNDFNEVESLMDKNLLNQDGRINKASFELIYKLEKYKKAKQYIELNGILFSIYNKEDNMIYIKKYEDNQYEIGEISKMEFIYSLTKAYQFINGDEKIEINAKHIDFEDFQETILKDINNEEILFIKKGIEEKAHTAYMYFYYKGATYKYNVKEEFMVNINPKHIRIELLNLFEAGGI